MRGSCPRGLRARGVGCCGPWCPPKRCGPGHGQGPSLGLSIASPDQPPQPPERSGRGPRAQVVDLGRSSLALRSGTRSPQAGVLPFAARPVVSPLCPWRACWPPQPWVLASPRVGAPTAPCPLPPSPWSGVASALVRICPSLSAPFSPGPGLRGPHPPARISAQWSGPLLCSRPVPPCL